MKLLALSVLACLISASSFADCGGVCVPGPGTPTYARQSCQMVNGFPLNIRADTCSNSNGCVWQSAQEVDTCVPGPGTPSYAVSSCQMINSFPLDIRAQTCVNSNGCVIQSVCQ